MCLMNLTLTQMREMVNRFNEQVTSEGKTEVVHEGDPDGTLFLINPNVSLCTVAPLNLYASTIFQSLFPTHSPRCCHFTRNYALLFKRFVDTNALADALALTAGSAGGWV